MLVSLQKRRVNGKRAVHTEYSSFERELNAIITDLQICCCLFFAAIDREFFRTHVQTLLTMLTQSITEKLQDFDSKQ